LMTILNIAAFGETMMATYLTFLAPDEVDSVIRAFDPRGWLARLGLQLPSMASWRGESTRRPSLSAYHQLEFPFEAVDAGANARTASAG
jgi:hypothetical protein